MHRASAAALLTLALAGCNACAKRAPAPAAAPVAAAIASSGAPAAAAPALVPPPALAPGPIVVEGYPHVVSNGMNDPAGFAGFTADDAELGYCAEISARDPATSWCETVARDGSTIKRSSDTKDGDYSATKKRELDAFVAASKLPELHGVGMGLMAPPLTGTWDYPDITLRVLRVEATPPEVKSAHDAFLRVGGALADEQPVYPVKLVPGPAFQGAHFVAMNGLALSHDGKELGMVGHFFACEWCDDWSVKRMPTGVFASSIYNDTGMRHHERKDWARAAELFTKATFADPRAKLPPYNLACARARLGDEAATRLALERALAVDPDVREKAMKDADLAGVRETAWFRSLASASSR